MHLEWQFAGKLQVLVNPALPVSSLVRLAVVCVSQWCAFHPLVLKLAAPSQCHRDPDSPIIVSCPLSSTMSDLSKTMPERDENGGYRASNSTSVPATGGSRHAPDGAPLINVQPLRREDLQPSYANHIGPSEG